MTHLAVFTPTRVFHAASGAHWNVRWAIRVCSGMLLRWVAVGQKPRIRPFA